MTPTADPASEPNKHGRQPLAATLNDMSALVSASSAPASVSDPPPARSEYGEEVQALSVCASVEPLHHDDSVAVGKPEQEAIADNETGPLKCGRP